MENSDETLDDLFEGIISNEDATLTFSLDALRDRSFGISLKRFVEALNKQLPPNQYKDHFSSEEEIIQEGQIVHYTKLLLYCAAFKQKEKLALCLEEIKAKLPEEAQQKVKTYYKEYVKKLDSNN